jgi:hypothetical protein
VQAAGTVIGMLLGIFEQFPESGGVLRQDGASLVLLFGRALHRVIHCCVHRRILQLCEEGPEESRFSVSHLNYFIMHLLTHPHLEPLVQRAW